MMDSDTVSNLFYRQLLCVRDGNPAISDRVAVSPQRLPTHSDLRRHVMGLISHTNRRRSGQVGALTLKVSPSDSEVSISHPIRGFFLEAEAAPSTDSQP